MDESKERNPLIETEKEVQILDKDSAEKLSGALANDLENTNRNLEEQGHPEDPGSQIKIVRKDVSDEPAPVIAGNEMRAGYHYALRKYRSKST